MHDREANSTKIAALSAAFEKAQNQLAHERSAREEAESVISALRGEVGLLTGKLERTDAELLAAREREREVRGDSNVDLSFLYVSSLYRNTRH